MSRDGVGRSDGARPSRVSVPALPLAVTLLQGGQEGIENVEQSPVLCSVENRFKDVGSKEEKW